MLYIKEIFKFLYLMNRLMFWLMIVFKVKEENYIVYLLLFVFIL